MLSREQTLSIYKVSVLIQCNKTYIQIEPKWDADSKLLIIIEPKWASLFQLIPSELSELNWDADSEPLNISEPKWASRS